MAFPTTISNVTFNALHGQGRSRPYISAGGNVYMVLIDSVSGTDIDVLKATDPTSSFSVVASTTLTTGNPDGVGTVQDGDTIHIVTTDSANDVLYHLFDMSDDTWTTQNEDTTGTSDNDSTPGRGCSIAVETDGSIIIMYQGVEENVGGLRNRVSIGHKPVSGSWTPDLALDAGGAVSYAVGGVVRGEANKFHLIFVSSTDANILHRSVQDVDGTVGVVETVNDTGISTDIGYSSLVPVYYDDGGIERVTVGWFQESSGKVFTSEIDDDGTPGAEEVVNATVGVNFASVLAVDEKTVWALWNGVDSDLFSDSNVDSAGWGTDNEELDAITLNNITANIYQRGSDVVWAYVYDDLGTIKYNEKVLRTVSGSTGVAGHLGFNL